jgi:hypothetical protein
LYVSFSLILPLSALIVGLFVWTVDGTPIDWFLSMAAIADHLFD